MKKLLILLICFMISATCAANNSEPTRNPTPEDDLVGTIWMHLDGEWQRPPADEDTADFRSAPATLIRFSKDFQFSMIHCWVTEVDENMGISGGDGQAIYVGIWGFGDSGINTYYQLVYEMIQPAGGGEYPGPEEKEMALLVGDTVRFREKTFTAARKLAFTTYEAFVDADGSRLKPAKYN